MERYHIAKVPVHGRATNFMTAIRLTMMPKCRPPSGRAYLLGSPSTFMTRMAERNCEVGYTGKARKTQISRDAFDAVAVNCCGRKSETSRAGSNPASGHQFMSAWRNVKTLGLAAQIKRVERSRNCLCLKTRGRTTDCNGTLCAGSNPAALNILTWTTKCSCGVTTNRDAGHEKSSTIL